jgi:replicative DNA helicase
MGASDAWTTAGETERQAKEHRQVREDAFVIQTTDQFDRLPPMAIDAEQSLVASVMLMGDTLIQARKIFDQVRDSDFAQADHGYMFGVLRELCSRNVRFDAVTMRAELVKRRILEEVGGTEYIAKMLNVMPSYAHVEHYMKIVIDLSRERQAITVANELIQQLNQPTRMTDRIGIISDASNKLRRICEPAAKLETVSLESAVMDFVEAAEHGGAEAIDTGFADLDRDYRGVLTIGGYTIVAGRPSMGKSTWVRDMIRNRAASGIKCGLIAREERTHKIAGNYLSSVSMIENSKVANPPWAEFEYKEIYRAVGVLAKLPLWINDSSRTIEEVVTVAEMMALDKGCKIVAVDHLHLIATRQFYEKKIDKLTDISQALKDCFKRLGIVGVVAAQLRRPPSANGEPGPPELDDLRECGALEEHADAVLMLHRDDYYNRNTENYKPDGLCQIGICKNRNGAVGRIKLQADLAHQRFVDAPAEVSGYDGY